MRGLRSTATLGLLTAFLAGCTITPAAIPVHDEPALLVDIAYDPHAGSGHSHPATISQDQLLPVLRGLQLLGRDVTGTFGLLDHERATPALSELIITQLAPLLATGLAKASAKDLVRFYLVQRDSQKAPLITSGGFFLRNRHLYVILANARTSPSSIQYENAYEPNSRQDPLLPIARFKFKTLFLPAEWRVETHDAKRQDGWEGYMDESKVVVIDLARIRSGRENPVSHVPSR